MHKTNTIRIIYLLHNKANPIIIWKVQIIGKADEFVKDDFVEVFLEFYAVAFFATSSALKVCLFLVEGKKLETLEVFRAHRSKFVTFFMT